jgi:lysozyme family protein
MTEDQKSAIYATGYWKGVEYKRMRELTDEEIVQIYKETEADNGWLREFVKAIIKKASERA